jgi:GNAT superfamily N-acetyltransferase
MKIRVYEVNTTTAWSEFWDLPKGIYTGDPYYRSQSQAMIEGSLFRADFAGRQTVWLASDDGRGVARVVARLSPTLTDDNGRPVGMLGFFEAMNIPDAMRSLFVAAVGWLRAHQAGLIVGPMDGDTWHRYRLNLGPFDLPLFPLEPYNPPFYAALWEVAGFVTLQEYHSKFVKDPAAAAEALEPFRQRVLRQGGNLRRLDRKKRFTEELRLIYDLSLRIFAGNFLYSAIQWPEFQQMYAPFEAVLDADFIWFSRDATGHDVGFVFGYPDEHGSVNVKTLGVVPERRGTGLAAALMQRFYAMAGEKGYKRVNLCLIRQGNPAERLDAGFGQLLRRYRLYRYGHD